MPDRATPEPERKRGIPPRWRIAAAAALACLLLTAASPAFANSYSRGNWDCGDFSSVEERYRSEPEDINLQIGYAGCLITRGDDSQGLTILHNIVDNRTERARVKAAWMVANYVDSGGTFEDTIDENSINEAIEAYGKVVFFIDLDPRYPDGNELYEEESQIELKSHYRLPLLYFEKFKKGAKGTDNVRLLNSPSYNGESNLRTYPEYNPYTIDSLNKIIKFSDVCLALPRKRHFNPITYVKTIAECRVLKEAATAILPLERERLALLNTDSCSYDLPQCSEHQEVKSGIISIIRQANSDIDAIIQKYASQK